MPENALVLFTKNPKLGHVKTRLAKDVGDEKALEIYKSLMHYTRQITSEQHWSNYLFYDQEIIESDDWPSKLYNKRVQSHGDLGDRLKHALNQTIKDHTYVMMIGSDCGVLTSDIISDAFRALQKNDVVIGPTEDGGYYLIGMNASYPFLFDGITWSTETVYAETMEIIKNHKLSCCSLQVLYDIDYVEDWKRLGW